MVKKFLFAVVLVSFFSTMSNASPGGGSASKSDVTQSKIKRENVAKRLISSGAEDRYSPFAVGDTIRSIPTPEDTMIMGIAWVNDTMYVLHQATDSDSNAILYKIDPDNGTVYSQFTLPFTGYVLGITFDGNNLWIVRFNPSNMIYHLTCTGTVIDSFASPHSSPRGIAWDGQYLWLGGAGSGLLYKMNTSCVVIDSVSTGSLISWGMDMVWVAKHTTGHLWVNDNTDNDINQLDVSGDTAILVQQILHPKAYLEGVCHDGTNLWVSDFQIPRLWQIDDGIVESSATAGDTIRTIPAPEDTMIMGIAWVRDTIYVLHQATDSDSNAILYKVDSTDGTVYSQFTLPFTGYVLGITFDGSDLWIVRFNPSNMIYHLTCTGTVIDSFASPHSSPRGIAWDGQYLWLGGAGSGLLYKMNTSCVVIDSVSTGSLISWGMDMVWVPEHTTGHLWVNDNTDNDINQLDVSGDTAILVQEFLHPENFLEGICHDGANLWVSDYEIPRLWQIDDGINENDIGVEENNSLSKNIPTLNNYPNPFTKGTLIQYSLSNNTKVTLAVYDIQGRVVRTLINKMETAGNYSVKWNGKDDRGVNVKNGIYFCQLKTNGTKENKKITVIR
ncbi:MAG: T9SS type A sorting domain-containing protein [bacterium]|nr:T9SS type A sorting domain-containing protein [bacterium]